MNAILVVALLTLPTQDERTERSATAVLDEAEAAFIDQEYERTILLVEATLARGPSLSIEERKRAYMLEGMSVAIARSPELAEPSFRMLLRLDPTFGLDPTAPPKILSPFKKVQAEEAALREQERAHARQKLSETVTLNVSIPDAVRGGQPVAVYVEISEGDARITGAAVQFRRRGKAEVSRFGLERQGTRWVTQIPGGLTASSEGFVLESWVTVDDGGGPLKSAGSPEAPFLTYVASGEVDDDTLFIGVAAGAGAVAGVALLGVGAWIGAQALLSPPQSELGIVRVP